MEKFILSGRLPNGVRYKDPSRFGERGKWYENCYNAPITSYEDDFHELLDGNTFSSILSNRKNPVVLDLMAPTNTLADLFSQLHSSIKEKTGISVCLNDFRNEQIKQRDKELGIELIAEDIGLSKTWREIRKMLKGRYVDLVIERAWGGLDTLPQDVFFFLSSMQRLWNMLSPNDGKMFLQLSTLQVSPESAISIGKWVHLAQKAGVQTNVDSYQQYLSVTKTQSSPQILPFSPDIFVRSEERRRIIIRG